MTQRAIQFSDDNGSTWDQTGANYPIVVDTGVQSNPSPGALFPQGNSSTAALSFVSLIHNFNATTVKWLDRTQRSSWQLYTNAVALDALRVCPVTGGALSGNLTGGTIYLFGR